MVLDFGLLQDPATVQTADYKSAGSNQLESLSVELVTDTGVYETIHTVAVGKTLFISGLYTSSTGGDNFWVATGAAASEVDIFSGSLVINNLMPFSTPIKVPSGTRLSVKTNTGSDVWFTLVGWEE